MCDVRYPNGNPRAPRARARRRRIIVFERQGAHQTHDVTATHMVLNMCRESAEYRTGICARVEPPSEILAMTSEA
eukprot:6960209-Prymnesium_polylepis.1